MFFDVCIYKYICYSSVGVYLIYKFKNLKNIGIILWYGIITALCNISSLAIFKFAYNLTDGIENKLNIDISLFLKYCLSNIFLSIVFSMIYVLVSKSLKVSVINEKNNKKNSK